MAASCGACPQGNGAMWCHGDCQWTGLQCVSKSQATAANASAAAAEGPALTSKLAAVASHGKGSKPLWARKRALPKTPVAAVNRALAGKTLSHTSQAHQTGTAHFLTAYKKADECTCAFHGVCTCEASMQFMQCISASCKAGCDCHEMQYHDACTNLQSACGDMGLTFDCSTEKTTCVAHEHTTTPPPPKVGKRVTHAGPVKQMKDDKTDPVTFLYQSLQQMKEDKCQLEGAVEKGYVNADDRLGLLVPSIEAQLGELESKCLKIPELRCDKDFEEFSGYPEGHRCAPAPTPPAPKKSGSARGSSGRALSVLALMVVVTSYP